MNTVVLYTTLVCLVSAIVSGVKCEIDSSHTNTNDFQQYNLKDDTVTNSTQPSTDFQHSLSVKNQYKEDHSLLSKCQKADRQGDVLAKFMKGSKDFYTCSDTHNITEIFKKLHGPRSEFNESVLKSLCKKVPDFHYCAKNATDAIRECFNEQENDYLTIVQNVTTAIESFACQNDAERISEFFSNGGMKCTQDKKSAINQCMDTLKSSLSNITGQVTLKSYSFVDNFKFTEEQCNEVDKLQSCVVNELKQCEQPTTANLGKSIFELILHNTPCAKFMKPNEVRLD